MDSSRKKKKNKKKKKKKNTSLLSFGDEEEEGNAFKIKKKKTDKSAVEELHRARKRARQKARQREIKKQFDSREKNPGLAQYGMSSIGQYTPDKIHALKTNAIHLPSVNRGRRGNRRATELANKNVNKNMVVLVDINDDENKKDESVQIIEKNNVFDPQLKRPPRRDGNIHPSSSGKFDHSEIKGKLIKEGTESATFNYLNDHAKRRIPFGDPGKVKNKLTPKRKPKKNATEIKKNQFTELEDDEELRIWEEEQIKKGGGTKYAKSARSSIPTSVQGIPYPSSLTDARSSTNYGYYGQNRQNPAPVTVDYIKNSLQKALKSLKKNHEMHTQKLDNTKQEHIVMEKAIDELKKNMDNLNEKYLLYQNINDFMIDALDCLNAKGPMIEAAHDDLREIYGEKAKAKAEQIKLHTQDQQHEYFGFPEVTFKKGEKDDFGRDLQSVYEKEKEQRYKIRERRRLSRSKHRREFDFEGWTTDETDDAENWENQRESLLNDADEVLSDVREEFATFESIKKKLELWKEKETKAYQDAYISLSVCNVMAPYVRLECLKWELLSNRKRKNKNKTTFDHMEWYQGLFNFGITKNSSPDDPDHNLVPKLVEKVVISFIIDAIDFIWDPLSSTHQRSMLILIQEAISHIDEKSKQISVMREKIMNRIQQQVDLHSEIPNVPTLLNDSSNKRRLRKQRSFCRRHWFRAVKLLRHIGQWRRLISDQALHDLCNTHLVDVILPFFALELELDRKRDRESLRIMSTQLLHAIPPSWVGRYPGSPISTTQTILTKYLSSSKKKSSSSSSSKSSRPNPAALTTLHMIRQLIQ